MPNVVNFPEKDEIIVPDNLMQAYTALASSIVDGGPVTIPEAAQFTIERVCTDIVQRAHRHPTHETIRALRRHVAELNQAIDALSDHVK